MDPIFGLPCINESRAMDNARNRNYIAEKMLTQKFESLDLAKKYASGKLHTNRGHVGDFLESLDLHHRKPPRRGCRDKKLSRSMSLRELDKRINEAKDRKSFTQQPADTTTITSVACKISTPSAKASNPNGTIILKKENTIVLNAFNSDSNHIVDLEKRERCLPINRQKHAMRDAWERATTEDVQFKKQRAHITQSPQHVVAQRGYNKLSCESPVLPRSSMNPVRPFSDHHKQKS